MKNINIIFVLLFIGNINISAEIKTVSSTLDYTQYLDQDMTSQIYYLQEEYNFWNNKLSIAPGQYPYMTKMSSLQNQLFDLTGKIEHLNKSTELLETANGMTNYGSTSLLRSLAKNYVSHHQFRSAYDLLDKAEFIGEQAAETDKMLFDVHMELGNYEHAECYLNSIKKKSSFDYLIRRSKWEDYIGNLDGAIEYMERALKKAESSSNDELIQWSYTNLADYYGHAGRIDDSYNHYLKALELNPNDAYAKKGIAWITYSYERNPKEALRILDKIAIFYYSPDIILLKSEIEEFQNNTEKAKESLANFESKITIRDYGVMYNTYMIDLYLANDKNIEKALEMANAEVAMRPTPGSYTLLAKVLLKNRNYAAAYQIMKEKIENKTYEPSAQLAIASVYKSVEDYDSVRSLKNELNESVYELGPMAEKEINNL